MEWEEPDRIGVFGRTITRLGRSVPIVADELDQGQHDGLSDVLGLDPAAVLVRHTVWQALEGFDPALPTVDDALDLGVRARLAGHRVAVVPAARVRFAADGVAGPLGDGRARTRRRNTRAARAAALHRRLAYAPALAVPFHWVSYLPLARAALGAPPPRQAARAPSRASSPRRWPPCSPACGSPAPGAS